MEDVLGGYTADDRFATFLTDWEAILARRVAEAGAAVGQVNGLSGLNLASGLGRGAPWPLSDIDLIPIFADDHLEAAAADVEALRRSWTWPPHRSEWGNWSASSRPRASHRRSRTAHVRGGIHSAVSS